MSETRLEQRWKIDEHGIHSENGYKADVAARAAAAHVALAQTTGNTGGGSPPAADASSGGP